MAVKEVICDNDKERLKYEEALIAITVEESLKRCGLEFDNAYEVSFLVSAVQVL